MATEKANNIAGDGTTTTATLAQAVLSEASRFLGDKKRNIIGSKSPAEIARQIETERIEVTKKLIDMKQDVETEQQLIEAATVSVEDPELGKLIGSAQYKLGKEGVLLAEETNELASSIEAVNGIKFDNGVASSSIINDQEKQALIVKDAWVINCNSTLHNLNSLGAIIDKLVAKTSEGGPWKIILIARAFSDIAIQTCLANINMPNGMKVYPINAPYTDGKEVQLDVSAVVGGTFYDYEGYRTEDMNESDVGYASKLIATRYTTIITGPENEQSKARVEKRVAELKEKIAGEKSDFQKRLLEQRLAMLENGFATVKVGASSEIERGYKKDKVDDAVNAVRSAFQEGVVPGAGIAFKTISESLPATYILKRPLLSIYEQIKASAPKDFVVEDWVKDSVKTLRVALEQACSVAGYFATAAGATATEREKPMFVQPVNSQVVDNQNE